MMVAIKLFKDENKYAEIRNCSVFESCGSFGKRYSASFHIGYVDCAGGELKEVDVFVEKRKVRKPKRLRGIK